MTALCMLLLPMMAGAQDSNPGQGKTISKKMPCKLLTGITERDYSIYLPGSYDTETSKTYPVLYLMHGGGGSHTDWEKGNNLAQVANRLKNDGFIEEMVIVCPEGNKQNMMYFNAEKDNNGTPDWKYEDYFFKELIPYIESNFRVRKDKGGRAIGGFSMGGGAATVYGVHHPECFCMVYDISGYLRRQPLEFLKNDPSGPWRQQVIEKNNPIARVSQGTDDEVKAWKTVDWKIAVGDRDFTLEANMDMIKTLRAKGIPCSMFVDDGTHDWKWIAKVLDDVLKRADMNFKKAKK